MIAAVISGAGESKRMGQPKMVLPWGKTTVLGHVIDVLEASSVDDIVVVCGAAKAEVEAVCQGRRVRTVVNEAYATGEMLSSVQVGLAAMKPDAHAALIVLGDQPQILDTTVRLIIDEYLRTKAAVVVPSYELHRGHPWLVARELWSEIARMQAPGSLREFLQHRATEIRYVNVDTPTILQDLDTPGDYLKWRP